MNTLILTFIHWNPNPYFFQMGSFGMKWYGLFFGLAIMSNYLLAQYLSNREGKTNTHLVTYIQYIIFFGVIGARLLDVFFYDWDYFKDHLLEIPQFWKGGLASHGGGLGFIFGTWLFAKRYQTNFWWYFDRFMLTLPLAGVFIRLGNLMNSEIYGKETDVPWAFVFERVDQLPRHPVQLYEAMMLLIVMAICWGVYYQSKRLRPAFLTGLFFVLSFSGRTLIELFKVDAVGTQLLNLPFILIGFFLIFYARTK